MKRVLIALLAVVILLALAPGALADGPATDRAGRAEVRFLEGMIDHHQMALDMAADCLDKAATESIRTLCQNIIDAQTAEIFTMRGWLLVWYQVDYMSMPMSGMMDMMGMMGGQPMGDMMGGMMDGAATPEGQHNEHHMGNSETPKGPGMMGQTLNDPPMMMGMMAGLNALEGGDYEIAWLEAMIDHHDDALHMSNRILERAEHEELRALAEQIIQDQTAEIEQMETLITELSAS